MYVWREHKFIVKTKKKHIFLSSEHMAMDIVVIKLRIRYVRTYVRLVLVGLNLNIDKVYKVKKFL